MASLLIMLLKSVPLKHNTVFTNFLTELIILVEFMGYRNLKEEEKTFNLTNKKRGFKNDNSRNQ